MPIRTGRGPGRARALPRELARRGPRVARVELGIDEPVDRHRERPRADHRDGDPHHVREPGPRVDREERADVRERQREDGVLDPHERRESPRQRSGRDASRLPVRRRRVAGGELEPVAKRRADDGEPVAAAARRPREVDDERAPRSPRRRARAARAACGERVRADRLGDARRLAVDDRRVASGVTSRGAKPVPPVVSTSRRSRVRELLDRVGDERPRRRRRPGARRRSPRAQRALRVVSPLVSSRTPALHPVGDREHGGGHAGSFVFSTSRRPRRPSLVDRLRHVVQVSAATDAATAPPSRHPSAPSSMRSPRSRPRRRQLEPDVDVRQRQRMTERNELGRPLGGHDPGEPCGRERIALGQRVQRADGLGRHPHPRASARGRRRETGLAPTSTMRTSPHASTWLRSPAARRRHAEIVVGLRSQLPRDALGCVAPRFHVKTRCTVRHRLRRGDRRRTPSARHRLERHVAAHEPRELARDREPQAAPRRHATLDPVEAAEHGVALPGRDARPVVLDDELRDGPATPRPKRHGRPSACA